MSGGVAGWPVPGLRRLPQQAWWESYDDPLQVRIALLSAGAAGAMAVAIADTEAEMALFRRPGDSYGDSIEIL
ncbi:MAG: hypothetical protein RQ752_04210, partial [Thermohalobaculum sp.]|nr:hypothetical protein [Thermohalobaculum sp.]